MTTTWKIFDTKSQKVNGLITEVTYGCIVQLGNEIDRTIGKLELVGDATAPNFVPFAQLTEETVIGWVKSSLGEESVTTTETKLQNNVTARKAQKEAETLINGLPWQR